MDDMDRATSAADGTETTGGAPEQSAARVAPVARLLANPRRVRRA